MSNLCNGRVITPICDYTILILPVIICLSCLLLKRRNGRWSFEDFRSMWRFVISKLVLLLTVIEVALLLHNRCRDISYGLIVSVITYVLFQGTEYVAKMDKWYKLRGGACATLMFYQMAIMYALRYDKFPIKVQGFAGEHSRIDSAVAGRKKHETGHEVEELKNEIEYVSNYVQLITAMLQPQAVMECNKENMNKFAVELQNIIPSVETALDVVANVNPDKDRLIFSLNRLLESNRILLYSIKTQDCINPREFLFCLKETLCADVECLKAMVIELVKYKDPYCKK